MTERALPPEPAFYRWVRGALQRHGTNLVQMELRLSQQASGGSGVVIETLDRATYETPEEIVVDLQRSIDENAAHWSGFVFYEIVCYNAARDVLGRTIVERRGKREDDSDGGSGPVEETSARGHAAQMMRHNESMFRMTGQGMQGMMVLQQNTIERLSKQNEHLMAKHVEVLHLFEELADRKQERDLRLRREERTDKIQERAIDVLFNFMPVLARKVLKGTIGESASEHVAVTAQVTKLATGILSDISRLAKIRPFLAESEKHALAGILQIYEIAQKSGEPIAFDVVAPHIAALAEGFTREPERFLNLVPHLTQDELMALAHLRELHDEKMKKKAEPKAEPKVEIPKSSDAASPPKDNAEIKVISIKSREGKP